jgi:hypothetical protein
MTGTPVQRDSLGRESPHKGWLACLATSRELENWTPKGPVP